MKKVIIALLAIVAITFMGSYSLKSDIKSVASVFSSKVPEQKEAELKVGILEYVDKYQEQKRSADNAIATFGAYGGLDRAASLIVPGFHEKMDSIYEPYKMNLQIVMEEYPNDSTRIHQVIEEYKRDQIRKTIPPGYEGSWIDY